MEKAFDFKDLTEKLKDQGLPMLEDSAEKIANCVFDWLDESVLLKGGLVAALAGPALKAIRELLQDQIDNIDKTDNEPTPAV